MYSAAIRNRHGRVTAGATLTAQPFTFNTTGANVLKTTNGFQMPLADHRFGAVRGCGSNELVAKILSGVGAMAIDRPAQRAEPIYALLPAAREPLIRARADGLNPAKCNCQHCDHDLEF